MKKIALFIVFTLFAACMAAGCTDNDSGVTSEENILSIRDIQSDPMAFTGEIKINGVASSFSETDSAFFTVMDTNELIACKNLYCGAYALPVRYDGDDPLPELADNVVLTGSFVKAEPDFYFEATALEIKKNLKTILSNTDWGGA
jgi:hypothetical protein